MGTAPRPAVASRLAVTVVASTVVAAVTVHEWVAVAVSLVALGFGIAAFCMALIAITR